MSTAAATRIAVGANPIESRTLMESFEDLSPETFRSMSGVMNHEQAGREDERWLQSLVAALRNSAGAADAPPPFALPPRPAWFNVITVCGLVVLLLPVSSSRLRDWIGQDRQAPRTAPSVLGWSEQRPPRAVPFDSREISGYRGLVEPTLVAQPPSVSVPALNAARADSTVWAPVRAGFGIELGSAPRVARFVLRNIPASATLSRGRRMPDGIWVIGAPALGELVIAFEDVPSRDLAIEIEGQSVDGGVVAREQVAVGQAPPAFAVATPPAPRVRAANVMQAITPHQQAPAVIADIPAVAVAVPAAEPSRPSRVADMRPPAGKARAKPRILGELLLERGPVVRTSASNMQWSKFAFDRD